MTPSDKSSLNHSDEKRKRSRLSGTTPGWVITEGPEASDPWEVRVRDVSRHGVGFESGEQFKNGETVLLRIGRGPLELARPVRVVHCQPGQGGTYTIGAEFV
jgi:hypothetical protein